MTTQNKADETKTNMYEGKRVNGKPVVTVSTGEKTMRLEPIFHVNSPSRKFDWGY